MYRYIHVSLAMAALLPILLILLQVHLLPIRSLEQYRLHFPAEAHPTSSGYLIANKSSGARMHYTFYEAQHPKALIHEIPLILWLQGGPGCSGGIGNFFELGSWRVSSDLKLTRNPGAWNRAFGVLFLDNPVGTGFSIAEKDEDLATDQEMVALHLLSVLEDFFGRNTNFQRRPFFIAGESYAGKYVPALGYYAISMIEKREKKAFERSPQNSAVGLAERPFRLEGLVIGNGLTDPKIQVLGHAEAAFQFGLIDFEQKLKAEAMAKAVVDLEEAGEWEAAHFGRTELVNWIQNASGLATLLDVRRDLPYHYNDKNKEYLQFFLNDPKVKAALNADPSITWVSCNPRPRKALRNDTMKSTKWMVDVLLEKLPVLLYQGLYDVKDGVASSEDWMRTLTWQHTIDFFSSPRRLWYVNGRLAGYWRSHDFLTHVVLRGAGHEVPADENIFAQSMIELWISTQLSGSSNEIEKPSSFTSKSSNFNLGSATHFVLPSL